MNGEAIELLNAKAFELLNRESLNLKTVVVLPTALCQLPTFFELLNREAIELLEQRSVEPENRFLFANCILPTAN